MVRKIIYSIFLTIIFASIGLYIGWQIHFLYSFGVINLWHSLGSPLGGATEFVKLERTFYNQEVILYVKTASDKIFQGNTNNPKQWEEVKTVSEPGAPKCTDTSSDTTVYAFSHYTGQIVDCTELMWSWEWTADTEYFIILTDGSIRSWRFYNSPLQIPIILCGFPILSIIIGWALFFLIRHLIKKRSSAISPASSGT